MTTINAETGEVVMQDPKALAALFAKLARAMGRLERLPKSGHNTHFNYDFVTDPDVSDAVRKALSAEGVAFFAHMRNAQQLEKKTVVEFTYTFADGETGATWSCNWTGEAIDTQDKGVAKAATSGLKYFLLKNFILSAGDPADDSDADNGDAKPTKADKKPAGKQPAKSSGNGTEGAKTEFFARVLKEIPYYNHVNHIANTLKQLGFTAYSQAKEDEMFSKLQEHASTKANEEAA